jgi:hypothetical protein
MEPLDDEDWESLAEPPSSSSGIMILSSPSTASAAVSTTETSLPTEGANDDAQETTTSLVLESVARLRRTALPELTDNQSRILAVSETIERRRQIKHKLMHHPIHLLWSRFLGYLLREIWDVDLRIRLALAMILLGVITKCVLLSTAVLWYPRVFIIPALILVPFFYLNPSYVPVTLERAVHTLQNPSKLADALSDFDPSALRRMVCASLFIPTLLEVRTIQFLSQIQIEATWGVIYHLVVAGLITAAMVAAYKRFRKSPRECIHIGLICLYGSALFVVTTIQFDIWKIPLLMAPFFLATGILLLHSVDDNYEWCTRAIHNSLRLSLRDALASVSESISQDEMLQLAMLRWLVDYWGTTQAAARTTRPTSEAAPQGTEASAQPVATPVGREATLVPVPPERELTWGELLPMLTMTSEQIRTEVTVLQRSSSDSPSVEMPVDQVNGSQVIVDSSGQQRYSSARHSSSSPSLGSVTDFQTMLASMDLDTHAKPAVMAYKKAVESFPPSREIAILLSVARRCPALLALLWELLFARSGSLLSTVTLLPFIAFELFRCKSWGESCKRAACRPRTSSPIAGDGALFLENVDPMVILLSGDKLLLHRPPTLLGVWMNVVSSVAALEMGLTAARCVQTTTAAIDFAQNIMSLAEFGYKVASRGWVHGAVVLAKEVYIHQTRINTSSHETKYTNAAIRAVENSRRVSQNLQVLSEGMNAGDLLPPLLSFVSFASGRGWLWGRDENATAFSGPQSTVVIEELDSTNSEEPDESNQHQEDIAGEEIENIVGGKNEEQLFSQQALDDIKGADDEKVETSEEERLPMIDESHFSEVMDLIAAASSRHLIDQQEKNDLCERLVSHKSDSNAEKEWLEATKRTLEGLILIDERAEDVAMNHSSPSSIETTEEDKIRAGNHDPSSVAASPLNANFDNECSDEMFVPIIRSHQSRLEPVVLGTPEEGSGSTLSDEAMHRVLRQCEEATGIQQAEEAQSGGDNIWVQIGGGLAVVGAVVGMAAIALQTNSSSDDRRNRERHRRNDDLQPSQ